MGGRGRGGGGAGVGLDEIEEAGRDPVMLARDETLSRTKGVAAVRDGPPPRCSSYFQLRTKPGTTTLTLFRTKTKFKLKKIQNKKTGTLTLAGLEKGRETLLPPLRTSQPSIYSAPSGAPTLMHPSVRSKKTMKQFLCTP